MLGGLGDAQILQSIDGGGRHGLALLGLAGGNRLVSLALDESAVPKAIPTEAGDQKVERRVDLGINLDNLCLGLLLLDVDHPLQLGNRFRSLADDFLDSQSL